MCLFGLLGAGVCAHIVCVCVCVCVCVRVCACVRWERSLLGSDLENVSLSSRFLKNKETKRHIGVKTDCTALPPQQRKFSQKLIT